MARLVFSVLVLWLMMKEGKAMKVRLVGTNVKHVGQVEIQYNGTWGGVCGSRESEWDIHDAHVVCRMLGYKAAEEAILFIEGENTTKLLLGVVECVGKEKSIAQCARKTWNTNVSLTCSYKTLAGVVCKVHGDPPPVQVRLAGGTSPNSGRVDVRYHGVWGTICAKWGWNHFDAEVVCRMLGYPGVEVYRHTNFSPVKGISWLNYLSCTFGTEISIDKCNHQRWGMGCYHSNDIGITCKAVPAPKFTVSEGQPCTVDVTTNRTANTIAENKMLKFYNIIINKNGSGSSSSLLVAGSVSKFTIGDGKYYNGTYNAPLEPGTTYNITVRAVDKAQNGGNTYGETASKTFTTNQKECKKDKTVLIAVCSILGVIAIISIIACVICKYRGYRFCSRCKRGGGMELLVDTPDASA